MSQYALSDGISAAPSFSGRAAGLARDAGHVAAFWGHRPRDPRGAPARDEPDRLLFEAVRSPAHGLRLSQLGYGERLDTSQQYGRVCIRTRRAVTDTL